MHAYSWKVATCALFVCHPSVQDGAWRVGEGVCCLTTPTHAYIARIKPSSGDLVMLFSIPQPQPGAQQQAVPVAAWMPHNRWAVIIKSQHCRTAPASTGLAMVWGPTRELCCPPSCMCERNVTSSCTHFPVSQHVCISRPLCWLSKARSIALK